MKIFRIAVHSPVRCLFDYLPPITNYPAKFSPGQRVRIPFGKKNVMRVGLIIDLVENTTVPRHKLKAVLELLDLHPVLTAEQLQLIKWACRYYHHPIGEVAFSAMPVLLRMGKPAQIKQENYWRLTKHGSTMHEDQLVRAKKQLAILQFIKQYPNGVSQKNIYKQFGSSQPMLKGLVDKQYIMRIEMPDLAPQPEVQSLPSLQLNTHQQNAVDVISDCLTRYQVFLLDGITGSGKTEVYMRVIRKVLDSGKKALVMTPEIGLTPQLIKLFATRFQEEVVVLHSNISNSAHLSGWLKTATAKPMIILGTRSAVWAPMENLGVIIVDEEHDLSYKQHEGLRYSAKDMSLIRARDKQIPVILGSATPALESIKNMQDGRYQELRLPHRASHTNLPNVHICDVRGMTMHGVVSEYLAQHIGQQLQQGNQILLFLNRRGYAPVMLCHGCGFIFQCSRCSVHLIFHKLKQQLICHHCNKIQLPPKKCPECGTAKIIQLGYGTERLGETIATLFPNVRIARIDRDTTQRKGRMQKILEDINSGDADILIGTQMLAKGHHFPAVTLVGIIDADRSLFSADYLASERMAQMFVQVSGRAGRGDIAGAVIAQTYYPSHPYWRKLAQHDYRELSKLLLAERFQANLPPFSFQVLIRAESQQLQHAKKFLVNAKKALQTLAQEGLEVYGPIPSLLEKRAAYYRWQLIIQAQSRAIIMRCMQPLVSILDALPASRKVRWSVDVDPKDMA